MGPGVVLVLKPAIDFTTFTNLSEKVLGFNPAGRANRSVINFSDAERFISSLAAYRDPDSQPGISPGTPTLLNMLAYGVQVVAEERDMMDILETASGMPFVIADTTVRGIMVAVICGTLAQWRDAVKTGTDGQLEHNVRACFCNIKGLFDHEGLSAVWKDFSIRAHSDNTFSIEDKRK